MMDCVDFLDGYSGFRDGVLPPAERERFQAHLDGCGDCARYHRVVGQGTRVLRDLPALEVSDDFQDRLKHRLWHEDARRLQSGRRRAAAAAVASLAAAAGLAAAVLLPALGGGSTVTMLPPVAVQAPAATASAGGGAYGLGARLEAVGVRVYPTPYREVLYRTASMASLASYGDGVLSHDPAAR